MTFQEFVNEIFGCEVDLLDLGDTYEDLYAEWLGLDEEDEIDG